MTQFCCAYEKLEQKHKLNIWLSVFFQAFFENLVFLLLLVELRTMDKVSEYLSLEKAIFIICFMIFFISIALQYMVSMRIHLAGIILVTYCVWYQHANALLEEYNFSSQMDIILYCWDLLIMKIKMRY